jgi:hypothetical protein
MNIGEAAREDQVLIRRVSAHTRVPCFISIDHLLERTPGLR